MRARRVILVGSTGSIGCSTLEVLEHLNGQGYAFEVVGLAAGVNHALLQTQAQRFNVPVVALSDAAAAEAFAGASSVLSGDDSAAKLVAEVAQPGDLLVAAVVGIAGLKAVLKGIECGCDIALANKETLVAAGAIVMPAAAVAGVRMLPIDSEHSAVFQCLAGRRDQSSMDDVARIVLTASGGPFRGWTREALQSVTLEQALDHPTWSMGRKITIDSATLVNKALEVIEAHWLFGLDADRIDVIVHPQSIMHGFVEFNDSSVLAQMGPPDMKTPIQVALTWPQRLEGVGTPLDWTSLSSLAFEQVDHDTFPSIRMAGDVIRSGGTAGAVFNAANEVAVEAFLDGRVQFSDIWECIAEAMEALPATEIASLDDVLSADASAREVVARRVDALSSTMGAGRD
jgi:1-deoxy-D-xylulose-5-phosphate reductoisomerase